MNTEQQQSHLTSDCVGDASKTALPVTLDAIAHHGGCEDQRCRRCLEHSRVLDNELIRLTNDQRADLLGEYHGWLSRAGIAPETNGGWWSREALSDANAQRFATERAAFRRPLEHCECPACRATIHSSDCAVHNMPAMPNGPCDCGAAREASALLGSGEETSGRWHVAEPMKQDGPLEIHGNVSEVGHDVVAYLHESSNADADAALIVRAVNSHDALVEALTCAKNILYLLTPEVAALGSRSYLVHEKIAAALAKAGVTP